MSYADTFLTSFKSVFTKIAYLLISLFVFTAVILFAIFLPNLSFLRHVADSSDFDLLTKVNIFAAMLGAINTNFTPLSRTLTLIVAALFSVNVSLSIYYFKRKFALEKSSGIGILGILVGMLGVGCASCGSVVLTSFFGLGTTVVVIRALPLKGQEFGILGIVVLILGIYLTAKKIDDPLICGVKKGMK